MTTGNEEGGSTSYKALLWILIGLWVTLVHASPLNRLIHSRSPYLQRHAHNPVAWYPWGREAFFRAQKQRKLIFLSIGYSTCHWCRVMEQEAFENRQIARLLNRDYINIKVDKEELSQVDSYYQRVLKRLSERRGGWPLSVIMTPERDVLYITTYVPVQDRYGSEGLETLLKHFAKMWHERPDALYRLAKKHRQRLKSTQKEGIYAAYHDEAIARRFVARMRTRFDPKYKGFDDHPRFPLASDLKLLLDIYRLDGNETAWQMASSTLEAMMRGGIYDQVEGGFFRYTTDRAWSRPHFEKMLYTNAQLIPLYVRLYLMSGDFRYRKVVHDTIATLQSHFGWHHLFFAASDADSEGREGGYYLYQYASVLRTLRLEGFGTQEAKEVAHLLDITPEGNQEEGYSNVRLDATFKTIPHKVERGLKILAKIRRSRRYPFIDRTIIASWNGMMIDALFEASKIEPKLRTQSCRALDTLMRTLYHDGTLYHKIVPPYRPRQKGLLEDYAYVCHALISGYEATWQEQYLYRAKELALKAVSLFHLHGHWYLDATPFRARSHYQDRYYPTPLAVLLEDLLDISSLSDDVELRARTQQWIAQERPKILSHIDRSAEATRLLLRLKFGDILLKGSRNNLREHKEKIDRIRYPFCLSKAEKIPFYLVCTAKSCLYKDENLSRVLAKIAQLRRERREDVKGGEKHLP